MLTISYVKSLFMRRALSVGLATILGVTTAAITVPAYADSYARINDKKAAQAESGPITLEAEKIAGVKKVAITQFIVQFMEYEKAAAGSGGFGGPKSSKVEINLKSMPDATALTQIAAQMYDDTITQLKTAGVEVMPLAELKNKPIWKHISSGGQPSPWKAESGFTQKSGGLVVAPHGYRIEMLSGEDSFTTFGNDSPKAERFISNLSKIGLQSMPLSQAEGELIAAGDASHVLRVRITVALASTSASAGILSSASAKAEVGLRFAPYFTRWSIKNVGASPFASPRIYLTEPSSVPVAMTLADQGGSSGNEGKNIMGALFGAGSKGTQASISGDYVVDHAEYAQGIISQHNKMAQNFAKQLAGAK